MTNDEAAKIALIASEVDGGCSVCARVAFEKLMRDFPEIDWKSHIRSVASHHYWIDEVETWNAYSDDVKVEIAE